MGSAHTASLLLMELQLWTEDTFLKKATGLEESFRTDSTGCIKIWGGELTWALEESNVAKAKRLNV